jgi:hypothetical protein
MQHDPMGYIDGMCTYIYVSNSPISFFDPYGLKKSNQLPGSYSKQPISIDVSIPVLSDAKLKLNGWLFKSQWCCKEGRNAGQKKWVTEINVQGASSDNYELAWSDMIGGGTSREASKALRAAKWVAWALDEILDQKAEIGFKIGVSGSLCARYDGCLERVTLASGNFIFSGTAYGKINLGGTLPLEKIKDTLEQVDDIFGVEKNYRWPDSITAHVYTDINGTAHGTTRVESNLKSVSIYSSLWINASGSIGYEFGKYSGSAGFQTRDINVFKNGAF